VVAQEVAARLGGRILRRQEAIYTQPIANAFRKQTKSWILRVGAVVEAAGG
jgi:hypothetical protein